MSIQTEINRIKSAIASAYTAVAEKGGTIPASKVAANLAAAVRSIPTGTDTSDATATAGDILSGKTAYAKGAKVTGTMATAARNAPVISVSSSGLISAWTTQDAGYVSAGTRKTEQQLTTQTGGTVTPTTYAQTVVAGGTLATGEVNVAGDANLKAENIKSGVSIFGVAGSYGGASAASSTVMIYKDLRVEADVVYPDSESELSPRLSGASFTTFGAFHLYAHATNGLIVDSTAINITVSGGVYQKVGTNRWLILPTSSNVAVALSTGDSGSIM